MAQQAVAPLSRESNLHLLMLSRAASAQSLYQAVVGCTAWQLRLPLLRPPPSLYHRHQKDSLSPGSRERSKASCQPAWLTDLVSRWKQVLSEGRVREGEGGFMVCTGTIMEEGVKRGGGLRWGVVSFFIVKAFSRKTSRTFGYMLRGWNNSTFSYFSQANI